MGCCSSRESSSSGGNGDPSSTLRAQVPTTSLPTSQAITSQTPLSQSTNEIHSPATSRAALNPISTTSLPSGSAVSSPGLSTNRHRHRGTTEATSSNLSEHYNLPLNQPKPWKSKSKTWTLSQLRRERNDFFDTRVTGQKEVWDALRQAVDCLRSGDVTTAQGILDAVGVTLPTGHMEDGCYDERGNLYKLPLEVLTDPTNLRPEEGEVDGETVVGVPAETKAKLETDPTEEESLSFSKETLGEKMGPAVVDKGKETVPEDAIELKCRLSDRGTDILLQLGKSQKISVLATRIQESAQTPKHTRIDVFYLGKKLDPKKTLEQQDFREGHVLNIFVVGAPK